MSKIKNQATAVPGAELLKEEKTEVKVLVPAVVKHNPDDLLQKIKNLESKLSQYPQSFEEKAKFFIKKQELVKKHNALNHYKGTLLELNNDLSNECEENDFESLNYQLSVGKKNGYRDDELIKINNPVIIKDLVLHVIERVNDRLQDYQRQIEA